MSDPGEADPTCPFCPFSDPDSAFVAEHVQFCHPETGTRLDTAFRKWAVDMQNPREGQNSQKGVITENPATNLNHRTAKKPTPTHQPRQLDTDDTNIDADTSLHGLPEGQNSHRPASSSHTAGRIKKLGRAELGPHAHEKQMPSWLRNMLEKGAIKTKVNRITPDGKIRRYESAENEATNVIPVLARLCSQDKSVQRAFFCSPDVHQITKIPREGEFCGYRNIQMLISYMKEARNPGHDLFPSPLPTILELQDMIEQAWDMGFNSIARAETGGIKGTRKYIGTPEAQALFLSLGIQCEASSIGDTKEMRAHNELLANIADYFKAACPVENGERILMTNLPPIYFQHKGHSQTIVGFEIRDKGRANLLVFDPMLKNLSTIKRLKSTRGVISDPARILKDYRRGATYLHKYKAFELLKLPVPNVIPGN